MNRKAPSPEVRAKGQAALAKWRKERTAAQKKGGKVWEQWLANEELKKAVKKTSPMQAIKNFCNDCVATRADITNCTARKCALWIYRPYQNGEQE